MPVRRLKRREIRATGEAIFAEVQRDLVRIATEHAHLRGQAIARESADWSTRAIERERQIAQCAASSPPPLVQAGLFDARAMKQKLDGLKHRDDIRSESDRRATLIEADSRVVLTQEPAIALLFSMLIGLSGSLVSHHFAERILPRNLPAGWEKRRSVRPIDRSRDGGTVSFAAWPGFGVRAIWDIAPRASCRAPWLAVARAAAVSTTAVRHWTAHATGSFSSPQRGAHRSIACGACDSRGIGLDARWVFCTTATNGAWSTRSARTRGISPVDLQQTIQHCPHSASSGASSAKKPFARVPVKLRWSSSHSIVSAPRACGHRSLRFGVVKRQHLLGAFNRCGGTH